MTDTSQSRPLRVLLSAGEASGDMYGAELIRALRAHPTSAKSGQIWDTTQFSPSVDFFGLGGEGMREAGFDAVVESRDVAVVGLFEVLSHLPRIYREFHRLLAEVERRRPDVAVLIDFPDWNLRLARELDRRGVPVVYYVSPQLWAWRTGRVKLVKRYVRRMLVIFPFEQEFYARHGVEAEFVGHPLAAMKLAGAEDEKTSREEFARRWGLTPGGLDPARPWIALLPGSRRKELRMNLPAMLGAARRLGGEFEYLMPVASTLDEAWVRDQIAGCEAAASHICQKRADMGHPPEFQGFDESRMEEQQQRQGQQPHPSQKMARMGHPQDCSRPDLSRPDAPSSARSESTLKITLTGDARASLLHARAAVVASGTATVEAALIGTPFVMVYRVGGLTWAVGRRLVKLAHFGMVNLIAGREVVPELIQDQFTPERVERELRALLPDGEARQSMIRSLAEVRERLRAEPADVAAGKTSQGKTSQGKTSAERAAQAVLRVAAEAARRRD